MYSEHGSMYSEHGSMYSEHGSMYSEHGGIPSPDNFCIGRFGCSTRLLSRHDTTGGPVNH